MVAVLLKFDISFHAEPLVMNYKSKVSDSLDKHDLSIYGINFVTVALSAASCKLLSKFVIRKTFIFEKYA